MVEDFLPTTASRSPFLAPRIVIVDGVPGCGKTMLSPIIGALDRVELLTYAYAIEHICALRYLGRVEEDAAVTMVRMLTDLQLYNTMMARETNFRPRDLSSAFHSAHPLQYLRRLFMKGDDVIPERIVAEQPILHLTTHNLLGIGDPVVHALGSRLTIVEVVRHPLYMLKQQALNMQRLLSSARHFTLYGTYQDTEIPFWAFGYADIFLNSNPVEQAIYTMDYWTKRIEQKTEQLRTESDANIITVPFERFVVDPEPYMRQIEHALQTHMTMRTRTEMRRQKVPRTRYAAGLDRSIYRHCGWERPGANTSEAEEFIKRRSFGAEHADKKAMEVLDTLSACYEKTYLQ